MASFSSDNFDVLRQNLKDILAKDVQYDTNEAIENVHFMWDALSCLIRAMKAIDPLFSHLYRNRHIIHTGSYYEGLRITSADEFDLNIVLELPFPKTAFKVAMPYSNSFFVTYQAKKKPYYLLRNSQLWYFPYKKIPSFFDNDRFLLPGEVLKWIVNLIEAAMSSRYFQIPKTVHSMKRTPHTSNSCPAYTMEITGAESFRTISVDLVPVINTCCSKMPPEMYRSQRFQMLLAQEKCIQWFLVPKPPKNCQNNDPMAHALWRCAFPDVEKKLLHNTGCLKELIKLFKLLRDRNDNWQNVLVSYYIKTFFLLKFDENPNINYWSEANLGRIFVKMLSEFHRAVETKTIPYYFNRRANQLTSMNSDSAKHISSSLKLFIELIAESPFNLQTIFRCEEKKCVFGDPELEMTYNRGDICGGLCTIM